MSRSELADSELVSAGLVCAPAVELACVAVGLDTAEATGLFRTMVTVLVGFQVMDLDMVTDTECTVLVSVPADVAVALVTDVVGVVVAAASLSDFASVDLRSV